MNDRRLRRIRAEMFGAKRVREYVSGRYVREVIAADDFGWISEIQVEIEQKNGSPFLVVKMYPGDTKAQGKVFFSNNPQGVEWAEEICGRRLAAEPYLRFAHFNSALFWLRPTKEEAKRTHNLKFFTEYAGRYQKRTWREFDEALEQFLPNGKNRCSWNNEFENSKRTYFDLAVGTLLTVYIPEEECRLPDNDPTDSNLVLRLRDIVTEIRRTIDRRFHIQSEFKLFNFPDFPTQLKAF